MACRSAAAEAADPRAVAAHERAMAFMAHASLPTGAPPPSSTGPSAPPGADPAALLPCVQRSWAWSRGPRGARARARVRLLCPSAPGASSLLLCSSPQLLCSSSRSRPSISPVSPQFPYFPSSRLDLLVEARADHAGMAAHAAALPLAAAAAAPHAGVRAAGAFFSTAALALATPSFSGAGVATAVTAVLIENQTVYARSLLMRVPPLTVPSLPAVLAASPAIGPDGHISGMEALFAPPAETAATLPSHAAAGSSAYDVAPSSSAPRRQELWSQLQLRPRVRALHVREPRPSRRSSLCRPTAAARHAMGVGASSAHPVAAATPLPVGAAPFLAGRVPFFCGLGMPPEDAPRTATAVLRSTTPVDDVYSSTAALYGAATTTTFPEPSGGGGCHSGCRQRRVRRQRAPPTAAGVPWPFFSDPWSGHISTTPTQPPVQGLSTMGVNPPVCSEWIADSGASYHTLLSIFDHG
jgi:hypothetical protein